MESNNGNNHCLNAFIVAINQACEGGNKCWYTSTLELQLVSLELCRACRSIPTLHVLVDTTTPRRLWTSRVIPDAPSEVHSPRVSSRVPLVGALGFVWRLSPDSIQLVSSTAKFLSFDLDFDKPIQGVIWPAPLLRLSFGDSFNQPIVGVVLPACLQQLSFGVCFDQPIAGIVWPASLQQLSFGGMFDKPIVGVTWSASLQRLSFGARFNQPILGVVLPACLQQLSFGYFFNQPILGVAWSPSLERLSFGDVFDQPIVGVDWPRSLQRLSFGDAFDQPIVGVCWAPSIESLTFGAKLRRSCRSGGHSGGSSGEEGSGPFRQYDTVAEERFRHRGGGGSSDTPAEGKGNNSQMSNDQLAQFQLRVMAAASRLQASINGPRGFNKPIAGVVWPASLKQLSFGDRFNQPILGVVWPPCLRQLSFGLDFKQPVEGIVWPASLQSVALAGSFIASGRLSES